MDNSFHNNNNNRNQESPLRFFCHHHGTINGWQPVKSLFHIFPSCRQTHTFPRNLKAAPAKDLRKHNTITEVWIFRPGAWQGACVATSSFTKAVNLTDDSSWQNSAHPRKRSTFGKQRGQYDAGMWFSMALHSPENPSFGGLQTARAACGTAFHQTLSWTNIESCVLSDTKACIVVLVWTSCLKDLEYTAVCFCMCFIPNHATRQGTPLLQLSIPQKSSLHIEWISQGDNPPVQL